MNIKHNLDEDKWDLGHRDDDGNGFGKKDRKHYGNKSEGFNKGGKSKEKTRPGKVKRMMQRNKKNSFAGNKGNRK